MSHKILPVPTAWPGSPSRGAILAIALAFPVRAAKSLGLFRQQIALVQVDPETCPTSRVVQAVRKPVRRGLPGRGTRRS
jgi:hypothetical protein